MSELGNLALCSAGLESLGSLLDPMEQEIILTWVSLCFITADLMGLQHPKSVRPCQFVHQAGCHLSGVAARSWMLMEPALFWPRSMMAAMLCQAILDSFYVQAC